MKILKIAGKIPAWLVAAVMVLLLVLNLGVTFVYPAFFGNADVVFRAPGLTTGFVPQGFHYLQDRDTYLFSGYMKDHSAARIYIRDAEGKLRFVELTEENGAFYFLRLRKLRPVVLPAG